MHGTILTCFTRQSSHWLPLNDIIESNFTPHQEPLALTTLMLWLHQREKKTGDVWARYSSPFTSAFVLSAATLSLCLSRNSTTFKNNTPGCSFFVTYYDGMLVKPEQSGKVRGTLKKWTTWSDCGILLAHARNAKTTKNDPALSGTGRTPVCPRE